MSGSKIEVAEVVETGIVIGLEDGTATLYSNELIEEMKSRARQEMPPDLLTQDLQTK